VRVVRECHLWDCVVMEGRGSGSMRSSEEGVETTIDVGFSTRGLLSGVSESVAVGIVHW